MPHSVLGLAVVSRRRSLVHVVAHPIHTALRPAAHPGMLYARRSRHHVLTATRRTGYSPPLVSASAVMLEPLAASVLTSLFPSRPLAAQVFASNSSFGTAMRSVKQSLASDFFTPHPRSVEGKGKGKALPEDEYGACSSSSDSCRLRSWEAVVGE